MRKWAYLCLLVFVSPAKAFDIQCLQTLQAETEEVNQELSKEYAKLGGGPIRVGDEGVLKIGRPDKGAVLVLHGFVSSPKTLVAVIHKLHDEGYTIYAPLLPGFGSSSRVANAYSLKSWRESVAKSYELLSECFPSLSIVGFSMGGALALDFLMNRYDTILNGPGELNFKPAEIVSVSFLSPFMELQGLKLKLVYHAYSFREEAPLSELKALSGSSPTPDLDEMIAHPESYNTSLPVKAVRNLLKLAETIQESKVVVSRILPGYLVYSRGDGVANQVTSRNFIVDRFGRLELDQYFADEKLPHMLDLHDEKSPFGREISKSVFQFIERSTENYFTRKQQELEAQKLEISSAH